MDTWRLVATERARLVSALAELTDADWQAPSLCGGWRTLDVLAHIVSTAEMTPGRFVGGMLRSGFRFNQMVATDIATYGAGGTRALLPKLVESITSTKHPPGPVDTMLLETVVHGEDIVFPLGRSIDHSVAALVGAAEFGRTAQPLVGCRKRIAGLRLTATDTDWTTGDGPEVDGPLNQLLLAMCGRKAAMATLDGPGVEILKQRS
jgi:uncharacterized protein (TIGR03083 family)